MRLRLLFVFILCNMKVSVMYWGPAREMVGTRQETVEVEARAPATTATLADLLAAIARRHGLLFSEYIATACAIAVDTEYVDREAAEVLLADVAEVSILPPVSSG